MMLKRDITNLLHRAMQKHAELERVAERFGDVESLMQNPEVAYDLMAWEAQLEAVQRVLTQVLKDAGSVDSLDFLLDDPVAFFEARGMAEIV